MKINKSTISKMLDIMDRFNTGEDIRKDLCEILDHEDYKVQFEFFQKHEANIGFTKEEYINFFINIRNIDPSKIASKALRYRINDLLHILDNIDYYRTILKKLDKINDAAISDAINKAKYGLPSNIDLGDVKLIFAIGVGVTGGFSYKNYTYYDLKVTVADKTIQGIINTIAHELHHRGYKIMFNNLENRELAKMMDSALVYFLSGEGCAVKYGNNVEGILTKKIYEKQEMTINRESYEYYISNFNMIYDVFKSDIKKIRDGEIKNIEELEKLYMDNYYYRDVIINGKMHKFYLKNPIAYYFGADIWGLIHDVYGRETVFELLKHPKHFFEYYNKALISKNRKDLCI